MAPAAIYDQSKQPGINILMTGAGAPGAAGIAKCLLQSPCVNLVSADVNPQAVGRYLTHDFTRILPASDPGFIDGLLSVCREKNIHVVLPLVTRELIPLAANTSQFELAGARVIVSSPASLDIANDKSRLYQFLQWRGIPLPAFRVVSTIDQFKDAVHELEYPAKPICFKPSVSNGSRGFRIIDKETDDHHLLFNEKPGTPYITYNEALRVLSLSPFPELLISEYLPGEEYSVDCLANKGEVVLVVPRLRKRMINGISVEGEFVENQEIITYCSQIVRELQLHGNIGMQVKRSTDNKFLLLEINPRVQGTISAGLGAGINLPWLAVKQELGLLISHDELQVKWGTRFSRYWSEIFYQ